MAQEHISTPRVIIPGLDKLGQRLRKVDHHLIALLSKRAKLAMQVQEVKHVNGDQPIIRLSIEDQRFADIRAWAEKRGINPVFAEAMLYFIIGESCKIQIDHLQSGNVEKIVQLSNASKDVFNQLLRENLLALTAKIAPSYDENYGPDADFATALYLKYENKVVAREVGTLRNTGNTDLAIDLGCATGRIALMLAPAFNRVIGYDISPHMITEAKKKDARGFAVEFQEVDLENGVPLENESASFAVMNLGTASDLINLRRLIEAIKRVLKKDGRFIMSFYNSNALLYHWYVPWPPSLNAEINLDTHCLNVRLKDKLFTVHARPYSVREIKKLLDESELSIGSVKTYPTITPILPSEFFDEQDPKKTGEMKAAAEELESGLVDLEKGAYILVTGRKP